MLYDDGIIRVRKSTLKDVEHISKNLRKCDSDEVWASNHLSPYEAVVKGFDNSVFCQTIENGTPIAIFGINAENIIRDKATVWMLATDDLEKIKKRVIKYSRTMIDYMLEFYPHLENMVDARNKKSIWWLRICGAKIDEPRVYGPENLMFRHFEFRK